MGEFVVWRCCLENNLLLLLVVQLRVLGLEEHQLVVCAEEEIMIISISASIQFGNRSNYKCSSAQCAPRLLTWSTNSELDETSVVRSMNNYWGAGIMGDGLAWKRIDTVISQSPRSQGEELSQDLDGAIHHRIKLDMTSALTFVAG